MLSSQKEMAEHVTEIVKTTNTVNTQTSQENIQKLESSSAITRLDEKLTNTPAVVTSDKALEVTGKAIDLATTEFVGRTRQGVATEGMIYGRLSKTFKCLAYHEIIS